MKKRSKEYNNIFYGLMTDKKATTTNLTSAQEIVPYILKLFPNTKSVVDVGCGIGTWASTFKRNGVQTVLGVDGPWVSKTQLLLAQNEFEEYDFESPQAYAVSKKFDLAVCLEVAEHLNEIYADKLINILVSLSDVVIFSAAIPNQGGVHHINEQYPSYWKAKFEDRNYVALDLLRGKYAENNRVATYYSQNTLIYINGDAKYPDLEKYYGIPYVVDFISPKMALIKASTTWKYLFQMQYKLFRAYIKKILISVHIIKKI